MREKAIIYVVLVFTTIAVVAYLVKSYIAYNRDVDHFVQACRNLSNKQLIFENVKALGGKVYVAEYQKDGTGAVWLEGLNKEWIDQYMASLEKDLDAFRVHVNVYNSSFDITRENLEDDWRCNIRVDKAAKKVKAKPYFQSE